MPTCETITQAQAGHWPLHDGLPLGPLPTAPSCARAHARMIVTEWGMASLADAVASVVTELITNAVAASRALEGGPYPVWLFLLSDRADVLVMVWDAVESPPQRLEPADDSESGRGLVLVDALAAAWGTYPATWDRMPGKVVWAKVPLGEGQSESGL